MIVKAIHHANKQVEKIYHAGEIIFQGIPQFDFHVIEDGKLIIKGIYSAKIYEDGLYIDCEPDIPESDWIYPVQEGDVLTIEQVYSAVLNGDVLEVE